MECVYCDAELDHPDRCSACRRGQPAGEDGESAPLARSGPLVRSGPRWPLHFIVVGIGLKLVAFLIVWSNSFVAAVLGGVGDVLAVIGVVAAIVTLLNRVESLEQRASG